MAARLSLGARSALTLLSLALWSPMAWSQQPPASDLSPPAQDATQPSAPFRLHVYANLVQVPTLVLSSRVKLPPPIARESFDISLDSGRAFHPTQMRMQGDDPIALGVLLDAGGDQRKLLATAAEALSKFATRQLHSGDSVTLYAVDCKVIRNLVNAPPEPALIREGVARLLAAPNLHDGKARPACGGELHLWDAVAYAANTLGTLPGRRVLLVISAGNEARSTISLQTGSEFLINHAVALFGMRDPDEAPLNMTYTAAPGRGGSSMQIRLAPPSPAFGDPFELLCAQNGGIVFKVSPGQMDTRLDEFMNLLRGRYILEFPRPDGGDAGMHAINITVAGKKNYLIRSTGVTIALPDASAMNDPNTLHSQPSPATFGKRKVLPQTTH